jgi:hypothetical protein
MSHVAGRSSHAEDKTLLGVTGLRKRTGERYDWGMGGGGGGSGEIVNIDLLCSNIAINTIKIQLEPFRLESMCFLPFINYIHFVKGLHIAKL